MSTDMLVGPMTDRTNTQIHALLTTEHRLDLGEALGGSYIVIGRIQRVFTATEHKDAVVTRLNGDRRLVTLKRLCCEACVECVPADGFENGMNVLKRKELFK